MPSPRKARLLPLSEVFAARHPDRSDLAALVAAGSVFVDGRPVANIDARVPRDAAIQVRTAAPLRGSAKLEAALATFAVPVSGRFALDAGAAAGGFTSTLLAAGAARVYAVDVGHGQLRGSLRQDPRVVVLERTNLGELDTTLVPDTIDVVTLDLSYLSLAHAVPQLERVHIAPGADLVALVKPMFELALPEPPSTPEHVAEAVRLARVAIDDGPWTVVAEMESPVTGAHGAIEHLLHARRTPNGREEPAEHVRIAT
jgi:23S rRNA (cytidine1920-2'-O)/16S rRNA (cytidine1409-2'-O)-methyltransferase